MSAVLDRRRTSPAASGRARARPADPPTAASCGGVGDPAGHAAQILAAQTLAAQSVASNLAARIVRSRAHGGSGTYHVCREFKRLHYESALVPADLRDIDESTRLSAEREHDLLVRMHYARFRADRLRRQLPAGEAQEIARDLAAAGAAETERLRRLLDELARCQAAAAELQTALLRAFLKLAIGQIRPFISRRQPFDELRSEAALAVLRCLEMFDPDRGFRFSTYATPAVRRRLARYVLKEQQRRQACPASPHLDRLPAPRAKLATAGDERRRWAALRAVDEALARLDPRERHILQARFGLEAGASPQSLQDVAETLGICRERVRQLEARALDKLRAAAGGLPA